MTNSATAKPYIPQVILIPLFLILSTSRAFSSIHPVTYSSRDSRNGQGFVTHRPATIAISSRLEYSVITRYNPALYRLRGGDEEDPLENIVETTDIEPEKEISQAGAMSLMVPLAQIGKIYGGYLQSNPILTKSLTAAVIFGLSDVVAQKLESRKGNKAEGSVTKKKFDSTRILSAVLVGLLYFGPAAHVWYSTIFRLLPGTSLFSTLQKATLGQILFGPSFTCVFFAAGLLQGGSFSISNWISKIKRDLPGAWIAGLGFWPLVDLFSYSLIPPQWIPLFVNFCSFCWTIFLSSVANRGSSEPTKDEPPKPKSPEPPKSSGTRGKAGFTITFGTKDK